MGCKLNLPLGPSIRDPSLEADLQARIDDGHKVWVIGDIHGHFATFRALIHRLRLSEEDRVICLGDMIDRGPDSAGLIAMIRQDPRIICLKGNHEAMAVQSLTQEGEVEVWQPWMVRGGKSTYGSYIVRAEGDLWKAKQNLASDLMWMDNLPTQIVLDQYRLVHAGYDPRMPLDSQGEKELLWIRKRWFNHDAPVDEFRTVFFGHSTTTTVGKSGGEVAHSKFKLYDGRPAWVAVDVGAYNHVSPSLAAVEIKSLRVELQSTLASERWFQHYKAQSASSTGKKRAKAKRWNSEHRSEAHVGDSFGLAVLKGVRRKEQVGEAKARRRLRMAGVVLMPEASDLSSELELDSTSEKLTPTYPIYARRGKSADSKSKENKDWIHNSHRIRLGPGTSKDRLLPHLPGPTRFTVHSRQEMVRLVHEDANMAEHEQIHA